MSGLTSLKRLQSSHQHILLIYSSQMTFESNNTYPILIFRYFSKFRSIPGLNTAVFLNPSGQTNRQINKYFCFIYLDSSCTKISDVNLSSFMHRHFHKDLFSIIGPNTDRYCKISNKLNVFMLYLQFVLTQILMNCWYMGLLHMGKPYIPFILY